MRVTMKPLYGQHNLRAEIRRLFGKQHRGRRRVACVAFIGRDCKDFVPWPEGLEVYCWPQPGATSAGAIEWLQEQAANVKFVDKLHAKVYWTEGVGAVVTSANLSSNALGKVAPLIEFGCVLPASKIDVDRIIRLGNPHDPTDREMQRLWEVKPGGGGSGRRQETFMDWCRERRPWWKFGWISGWGSQRATRVGSYERDKRLTCTDYLNCDPGDYKPGDWILGFMLPRATNVHWMFVNDVVRNRKGDRNTDGYAYVAVQVGPSSRPPFRLDKRFRIAFKAAVKQYGSEKVKDAANCNVPPQFRQLLRAAWNRGWIAA